MVHRMEINMTITPPSTRISRVGEQLALDYWAHWFFNCPFCDDETQQDDDMAAFIAGGEL